MFTVGLTGGIGSGKTVVSELFAQLGVPIIDADKIALQLTQPHQPALIPIREHFGDKIFREDDILDRKALRSIIFTHPLEKQWLENLLHPLICKEIKRQLNEVSGPYCIVVIPLLIEVTDYTFLNRILVVDAPSELQMERVQQRDKVDAMHTKAILNAQTSRQARISKAHDVIINDGKLEDLHPQVAMLHERYLRLSGK